MTNKQKQALRKCGIPEAEWAELEAGAKKARQADRKPTERKPREKKQDADKETLLNALFSAILPMCESYEIANAEREFLFTFRGRKYKVVLSCPRS